MMKQMSPALQDLIFQIRAHPGFDELLKYVEAPLIPRFKRSQAANVEQARAEWIYASGRRDQQDFWLNVLAGKPIPPQAE